MNYYSIIAVHSIGQSKSQGQPRFREWRNRFSLLMGGAARLCHKDIHVSGGGKGWGDGVSGRELVATFIISYTHDSSQPNLAFLLVSRLPVIK